MNAIFEGIAAWIGEQLGRYLSKTRLVQSTAAPTDPDQLMACLQPGDVLLVEGKTRVSVAIKYLTQSTWSHAALFVGQGCGLIDERGQPRCFIEADLRDGVRAVTVDEFADLHCRVCRPIGLNPAENKALIAFVLARLGQHYDLKNVTDLARYLLPTPPVPVRWRRRMLALGSGDPTRAICSTLIAEAFQSVRYPILPIVEAMPDLDPQCIGCRKEILQVRHHSLFVPRDFDLSPYFEVVKPELLPGFDFHTLRWRTTPDKLMA